MVAYLAVVGARTQQICEVAAAGIAGRNTKVAGQLTKKGDLK